MTCEIPPDKPSEYEQEYIFIFNNKKSQILFEFFYLVFLFILACGILFFTNTIGPKYFEVTTRWYIYSFIGGLLGGWTFDVKWFYRVTARGKDNQHRWFWEASKIYWRILIPFLAATISFAIYIIAISSILPFITIYNQSGLTAFGFSYIVGCFSDLAFGKISEWAMILFGKKTDKKEDHKA